MEKAESLLTKKLPTFDTNVRLFAPLKINLYLHITGTQLFNYRDYHELDSLFAFADYGDWINVVSGPRKPQLKITGPFAPQLKAEAPETNLILRAHAGFCQAFLGNKDTSLLNLAFEVEKNSPSGAGFGGGSSDAGAVLAWLAQQIGLPLDDVDLIKFAANLGADVPACLNPRTQRARGIGDDLEASPPHETLPYKALVVWPGLSVSTGDVFKTYASNKAPRSIKETEPAMLWSQLWNENGTLNFSALEACRNDLEKAACSIAPEITETLNALKTASEGLGGLVRMSGSGSGCFVLFAHTNVFDASDQTLKRLSLKEIHWAHKIRLHL